MTVAAGGAAIAVVDHASERLPGKQEREPSEATAPEDLELRREQADDVRGGKSPSSPPAGRGPAGRCGLDYVWQLPRCESSFITVVIPEQFKRRSLVEALMRRTAFSLNLPLLREPGVVITDVPLVGEGQPLPKRAVCRVFVSGGHAASLRAANYARTLGIETSSSHPRRLRRPTARRRSGC